MTNTTRITDRQIRSLRAEASAAGDIVQVVICTVALDDPEDTTDECDADGVPDYTGGGHSADELRKIAAAVRMSVEAARAECARLIANAAAQVDA